MASLTRTAEKLRVTLAVLEVAVKNQKAYFDPSTGTVLADPGTATNLFCPGYFGENRDATDDRSIIVVLWEEIVLQKWLNDTEAGDDIRPQDLFSVVYGKDGTTASRTDDTGARSPIGRPFLIEGTQVYITDRY